MCILCNDESLRLLAAPLSTLSNVDVAESIRGAREAAMQLVLDTADAWADSESGEPHPSVDPEDYLSYVVDRAENESVFPASELRPWRDALRKGTLLEDPRVQAFLSSAVEGLALYITQIRDKRTVLERFLEVAHGSVGFGGIGSYGEIFFEHSGNRILVLTDEEAMQIAVDQISSELYHEDPSLLLRYSSLPDEGLTILSSAQQGPSDRANEILAGIVDVPLLAEDTVRQSGYGRFVAAGLTDDFTEQRFGDLVILTLRLPDDFEAEH
jgi:hypothetical protein